jgi:hypothetical protein
LDSDAVSAIRRGGELTAARMRLMSLGAILLIILVLILLGVFPTWSYSNSWGYAPSGLVGTVFVVVLILVLLGRI